MTIHITPEPDFSYVSFESNVAAASYGDLITRVIETFKPGKFVVTIFANKVCMVFEVNWKIFFLQQIFFSQTSPAYAASRELEHHSAIKQWKRDELQYCRFPTYDLTYAHYCKFPS